MSALRTMLRTSLDALASLAFPAPCRICGETLTTASRFPICPSCLAAIQPITQPFCAKCGRPFLAAANASGAELLCQLCRRNLYAFDVARSYAAYDGATVDAITLLKYQAVAPLGRWFANRLFALARRQPTIFSVDAVAPVPLFPARQRERGYNQAELIARPLARLLGLPLRSYLLVRSRPRPDKLRLSRKERWRTVRGAYSTREGAPVDNLRVLLVDDVFTTGATMDACARALKRAGAAYVVGLTVARVVPDWIHTPETTAGRLVASRSERI